MSSERYSPEEGWLYWRTQTAKRCNGGPVLQCVSKLGLIGRYRSFDEYPDTMVGIGDV